MKSKKQPFFSLIIPHINEGYYLDAMFDSIAVHVEFNDYEIILVDDGSDHVSDLDFIDRHPLREKIRIFHERNLGSPGARNFGAKQAKGKYLFFLDAHMYFVEDSLKKIHSILIKNHQIDFLQPAIGDYASKRVIGKSYKIGSWELTSTWDDIECKDFMETPCISGAMMVVKETVFKSMEGFHPFLEKWGTEDIEISMRAWLLGYKCYFTLSTMIAHRFKESFTNTRIKGESVCMNKIFFIYTCFQNTLTQTTLLNMIKAQYGDTFLQTHSQVLENKKFQTWRSELRDKFQHNDAWYFKRFSKYYKNFSLFYPTTPVIRKKKSKKPEISVIMATYNSEKYLEPAIESVLSQTFQDFEFIIVDDGSTDETYSMLKRYQKSDERIYLYKNEKNLGASSARNTAIRNAKGKYIITIDSDDISSVDSFYIEWSFMKKNPSIDMLGVGFYEVNSYGVIDRTFTPITNTESLRINMEKDNYISNGNSIRKNDGSEFRTKLKVAEDYDLWLRFLQEGKSIHNIITPLYYNRLRTNSLSHSNFDKNKNMTAWVKYFYYERKENGYDNYEKWDPDDGSYPPNYPGECNI